MLEKESSRMMAIVLTRLQTGQGQRQPQKELMEACGRGLWKAAAVTKNLIEIETFKIGR